MLTPILFSWVFVVAGLAWILVSPWYIRIMWLSILCNVVVGWGIGQVLSHLAVYYGLF